MKRIIGLFLLMLLNVLLYAQNNRYKVVTKTWHIKGNKEYKLEKDEIIESDMSTFYVTYDYYNDEKELFNLYLKANYKNEEIYMYAYSSELELIDSIKLFNQEFNCFIPVYYLDVV